MVVLCPFSLHRGSAWFEVIYKFFQISGNSEKAGAIYLSLRFVFIEPPLGPNVVDMLWDVHSASEVSGVFLAV